MANRGIYARISNTIDKIWNFFAPDRWHVETAEELEERTTRARKRAWERAERIVASRTHDRCLSDSVPVRGCPFDKRVDADACDREIQETLKKW